MAQPVWVLSVDLQTKTATFQSGMADAAKSAGSAFKDIKSGADDMSKATSGSMSEARHGVMLLGEEFGVHLPRALTTFIAGIAPVGAAMEAAFPFLAIIVGATLLIEHLAKVQEKAESVTRGQVDFGTAVNNSFNLLEQKLLQAQIRADELNKNHLGALKKQLELIDLQSLAELGSEFDKLSAKAEQTFKGLESHFYTLGIGSDGAKHALLDFKTEYESLLSQGRNKEASDLLAGTLASAEHVLAMQKQYLDNQMLSDTGKNRKGGEADYNKFEAASLELKKAGVSATRDEVLAQESLVTLLRSQVNAEAEIGKTKNTQKGNAQTATGREVSNEAYNAFKKQAESDERAQDEAYNRAKAAYDRTIALLETGEREKIEATKQGSQERLQAIDDVLHEEEKRGLEETEFYRELGVQRVKTIRQMAEEEARIRTEAGRQAAQHAQKMGELEIATEQEVAKVLNSERRVTQQELIAQDIHFADAEYAIQLAAINKQIVALDRNDKDYSNKRKALYDRHEELERAHQNKLTEIKDHAEIERNARMLAGINKEEEMVASGLASVLMRHQSFGTMLLSMGDQIATGMLKNALMDMMTKDMTREKDAAHAARQMFIAGSHLPFPANIVAAPAMGAAAFAAVMAFEKGGIVPGVGRGDTVPAVLTPGEHVADKELTEGLRGMVRSGGAGPRHVFHVRAHFAPVINAVDADGVDDVLTKHQGTFQRHFESALRRANQ